MKKIFLNLLLIAGVTCSSLNAELVTKNSIRQRISSVLSNKQQKNDLIKGAASLVGSIASGMFYLYVTDFVTANLKDEAYYVYEKARKNPRNNLVYPYNTLDEIIYIGETQAGRVMSYTNINRLGKGIPLLLSFNLAIYGVKKIASVVKALKNEQANNK